MGAYPNEERLRGMRQTVVAEYQSASRPLEVDVTAYAPEASAIFRQWASEFVRAAADRLLAWARVISEQCKIASIVIAAACAIVTLIAMLPKPGPRSLPVPQPASKPVLPEAKTTVLAAPEPATPVPDAVQPAPERESEGRAHEIARSLASSAPHRLYSLEITTEPAGARVNLHSEDSENSCTSPCASVELAAGRYGIEATLPGYRTKIRVIHVPEIRELHLSLDREEGFIVVQSEVADAPIIIDGKDSGRRTSVGASEKLPLAPGKHVVSVPGGAPQPIEVRDGQLITVRASK